MQESIETSAGLRQKFQQLFGKAKNYAFNSYSQGVFKKLSNCHTSKIGVHVYSCDNVGCQHLHHQYHSCGNRHCPNCGALKRERWVIERLDELLPTSYFHIVFTLPSQLHSIMLGNRVLLFNLLFKSAHYTLNTLGQNKQYLGARPGILSVLHTWGQQLSFHPHVHCIVSGGGVNDKGNWVAQKRANGNFLFPRKSLERIFKEYFLAELQKLLHNKSLQIADEHSLQRTINYLGTIDWNVYAKAPFAGAEMVIKYLANYTHKTAITFNRVKSVSENKISFSYKDYRQASEVKIQTLSEEEFLRRFEQHILPQKFVRIRYAGYMSHQNKEERLTNLHKQLLLPDRPTKILLTAFVLSMMCFGADITKCPKCKTGTLKLQDTLVYHNGMLRNVNTFNKGSPQTKIVVSCSSKN